MNPRPVGGQLHASLGCRLTLTLLCLTGFRCIPRPNPPPPPPPPHPPTPTFPQALRFWLNLGFVSFVSFVSFGGPAGQIALMHLERV